MILIFTSACAALVCAALAARAIVVRARRTPVERLEGILAVDGAVPVSAAVDDDRPFRLVQALARLVGRLAPEAARPKESPTAARLSDKLIQAGFRQPSAPAVFVGLKLVLLVAAAAPAGIIAYWRTYDMNVAYAAALLAGLGFFTLPNIFLAARIRSRHATIDRELPDVLDLLVVCTQSGLGLDAAVDKVAEACRRTSPTVAGELLLMNLESQIGRPRQEVLRNLARRTGTESARALAAILIQSDRFGTSVSQALAANAEALRIARQQRAEEAAGKAAVKILFPLIFCIFPAIFLVVAGPAVIRLMDTLLPLLKAR